MRPHQGSVRCSAIFCLHGKRKVGGWPSRRQGGGHVGGRRSAEPPAPESLHPRTAELNLSAPAAPRAQLPRLRKVRNRGEDV